MAPLERRRPESDPEEPGGGDGLSVELDTRVCPTCRREFPAWNTRCPADGTLTVRVEELAPPDDPLLARFRDRPDEADGRGHAADTPPASGPESGTGR